MGASRWLKDGTEHLAGYSSGNQRVDIYASGGVGTHQDRNSANQIGTSISAPAVAAAMATAHGANQRLNSSQVQNLMRQSLTHQIQGPSGALEVLEYQGTSQFMQSGKF